MKTITELSNTKIFGLNLNVTTFGRATFWGGLLAGTLDAAAGVVVYFIYFKWNPLQVLQFIASGVFGPSVINGDFIYVVIGLILHFIIAFIAAAFYIAAATTVKAFNTHKVVMGLAYGVIVWLFMNLLVLPVSNVPKGPFDAGLAAIGIVWHALLVGLPIALVSAKHYLTRK